MTNQDQATRLPASAPRRNTLILASAALLLGGCSTLPSSGPTTRAVLHAERNAANVMGFKIVDVDASLVGALAEPAAGSTALAALASEGRVDTIGPGDVLQISIFEVGAPLFSGGGATAFGGDLFDPSARREQIPGIAVDEEGMISLPYIGRIQVANRTPAEIQQLIEQRLVGKSQSPQAIVTVRENVANTVFVMGEARKPGRLPLTGARERLLDAIATAGGTVEQPEDIVVRFTRAGRTAEEMLAAIRARSPEDLPLLSGDRIELVKRPRTYTVFGATNRVSQNPFAATSLSLAEAVARVGGPNDQLADPSAVFVFRYVPGISAENGETPIIYRLNLLKPSNYFLAQRFAMRDKDVIYIANSASNQPTKLVQIINQLFSPVFLLRQATR